MEWLIAQAGFALYKVAVFILVIGVLVFVHELGHFLFAKMCGVGVVRFAVGFGPALCRFKHRETQYQIGIIPLGGYVRMVGDMPDMITGAQVTDDVVRGIDPELEGLAEASPDLQAVLSDRNRWFVEKNLWQRASIVFAGPLFNFLFTIFLIFLASLIYGEQEENPEPRIGEVAKNAPAQHAGLQIGDFVRTIDGKPIANWEQLARTIRTGTGSPITLDVMRGEENLQITVQPQAKTIPTPRGETITAYVIGIGATRTHREVGAAESLKVGVMWTFEMTRQTYIALWGMLRGKMSPKDLAGPLFIFDAAGKQAEKGVDNLLYFMALLSVSLAVLNLLPIPILDGGHLLFFFIEAVIGPISLRKKEFAQQLGMLLLISLMVFAIHNDIFRDTRALEGGVRWDEKAPPADKTIQEKK